MFDGSFEHTYIGRTVLEKPSGSGITILFPDDDQKICEDER
jgi:hypothetical protein